MDWAVPDVASPSGNSARQCVGAMAVCVGAAMGDRFCRLDGFFLRSGGLVRVYEREESAGCSFAEVFL